MSAEHSSALRAVAVSKQYTATTALDAVDFDLSPGEVHGLVGENGAGKSTLVKVLTGVSQPTSGQVTLSDEPIVLASPRTAAELGIAVVHQDNQLFEHLRVWEHLAVSQGRPTTFVRRRAARAAARAIFDRLDVSIDVDATAGQLAPTERKVVEIARALARSSRFLLLDEPTAALDDAAKEAVEAALRGLGGVDLVLVTHDRAQAERLAQRTIRLEAGRVAA
jgi:ABC-type sugar transport system ATPase subunit